MFRSIDKWLKGWIDSRLSRPVLPKGRKHLVFCVADHFEPFRMAEGKSPSEDEAQTGVMTWLKEYLGSLDCFRDADGKPTRHTFFYPAEDYNSRCLDLLVQFCGDGFGEVEIQLHHRNDTPEGFTERIETFKGQLAGHGLLGADSNGNRCFGFVHGNWSLCNSRPDGDWCGVNEELGLLQELGCFADFTFPSAPSPTQPRMVNCIYRAIDTPGRPRGHDAGVVASVGSPPEQGLMLITGPMGIRWGGIKPRLENSAVTSANAPTRGRVSYWVDSRIGVRGRPEWIFVKVHMHGLNELDGDLLVHGLPAMHHALQRDFNDGNEWCLHYTTAREMYNIARAAECGKDGDPGEWRDFEIGQPELMK